MSVIAKSLMKWLAFANGAVNQVGIGRRAWGKYVGFNRNEQLFRCIGKLAQYRLTADDHKLFCTGDTRGSPNDMLKLWSLHGGGGL